MYEHGHNSERRPVKAGKERRFCCQKRFGFNNRLTGSKQKLAKKRRVGPIYFTVNDTSPAITARDKCPADQPEAPGGSNNSMAVMPQHLFHRNRLRNRLVNKPSGFPAQVLAPVCC